MRELTLEELREVNGGMRGNPGNLLREPYFVRGAEPEFQHVEYPLPQHAPSLAQSATCATLATGAALMAIPLGPMGAFIAGMEAKGLCDVAFERAQR